MGDRQNGIQNSPFSEAACPVPSSESGDQGIGGGITIPDGPQGIISSPWQNKPVPELPTSPSATRDLGNPSQYSNVDGSTHQGVNEMGTVGNITTSRNTIDRK